MIASTHDSIRRAWKQGRRWLRNVVKRLDMRQKQAPPYRPEFNDSLLATRLGIPAPANTGMRNPGQAGLGFEGARRARELFGTRFFVDPADIEALSRKLEILCPGTTATILHSVEQDRTRGIPVYSLRGPALGPAFPWGALAFGPGRDPLYALRPHRFAFAPRHAWACLIDPAAAQPLRGMIRGWMECASAAGSSFCYDSNLGVIQRILALSWAWAFLAARPEEETATGLGLEWDVLHIIAADIRFLEPVLGKSVPNNHLLADWFAGWLLGTLFPELLDLAESTGEQRWCEELLAQTYPDGGSFEHSSHYHEFASEMGVAYLLLARQNALVPDPRVTERVKALLAYQCDLTGPESSPLPIGNAIEDTLFPLDPGEAWCSGALRECYRALFRPEASAPLPGDTTRIRAFWLLGGALVDASLGEQQAPHLVSFAQAGVYVLADEWLDARLVFRSGPAPDTALTAGHMHSDLLAVYVNVQGLPFLVDAGTYTYRRHSAAWENDEPAWRAYFGGPEAHNGFCISRQDPLGPITGDFRRRAIPACVSTRHETDGVVSYVEGRFDSDNAYHGMGRTCVQIAGEYWLLLNTPPTHLPADTPSWLGFQFDTQVTLRQEGPTVQVTHRQQPASMFIVTSQRAQGPQVLYGSIEPLGGWVSPRYGEKLGAPQLRYPISEAVSPLAFLVTTDRRYAGAEFVWSQTRADGAWLVALRSGDIEDWILVQPRTAAPWVQGQTTIDFDGRMLWLRKDGRQRLTLRWLGATRLEWPDRSIRLRADALQPFDLSVSTETDFKQASEAFSLFEWPHPG